MKRIRKRLRRGWIMHIVRISAGETNDKLIQASLAEAGYEVSMPELHGELRYLEEKGYLRLTSPRDLDLPFEMLVAELTAKGQDLLDGSIEDVGVQFSHQR